MPDINQLPNISELPNIETNFKVFAGPGAGKTTWLIQYLEKVLKESKRLNKTRKIACITYTNVATEEILNRLDCDKSRFDISTIHSFLYRNIIKPFSFLIAEDDNGDKLFEIDKLDGHDEHIPRIDKISSWINTLNIGRSGNRQYWYLTRTNEKKQNLYKCLMDIDWKFTTDNSLDLKFRNNHTYGISVDLQLPTSRLVDYKTKYWHDGIMHHEDVLYFSYLIINKSPRILEFVRSKFPYIFIDEFQDTTELQTWIIKKIAELETKIGVIGDLAQSIYKFTGAKRSDFENLQLEGLQSYKLDKNHRSTKNIIDFLNCLRADITQETTDKTIDGEPVKFLVGPVSNVLDWLQENSYVNTYILTRKNETVEEIKNQTGASSDDLLKKLYGIDSNSARVKVLHSILMGFKFYQKGYLKDAIKEALKPLKSKAGKLIPKLELRKIAIKIVDELKKEETVQKSVFNYYMELLNSLDAHYKFQIGSRITGGNTKSFYESISISDLLMHIRVDTKSEDTIRTIHSAKGTEFECTLVHFEELRDFENYVFDAPNRLDLDEDDARIYYVGFSRAKRNLFINIPEINGNIISKIEKLNIEHEILN
jgi:DNA helicase-2/ATP-dependent DNA helicase PcrA